MDKACVVGCTALDMAAMKKAKKVTIDGATGNVWIDVDVPVVDASDAPEVRAVMSWCLDATNAVEAAAVDLGLDRTHRVMAAHWWGNADVLKAVLDGIADLPTRSHVSLDLRSPWQLTQSVDADLEQCFGVDTSDDAFKAVVQKTLVNRAKELDGVSVYPLTDELSKFGYGLADKLAVPADYAAFGVLGK